MADRTHSYADNVPGAFYVDDSCIDCDMCLATASQNFERNREHGYSYIAKQPANEDEWALCLQAMEGCPVSAIGHDKDVNVPVLGIVENMSYFVCDECNKRHEIFRYGGGRRASEELGVPFLGEVPLDPKVTWGGDQGAPVVTSAPDSPASQALREVVRNLIAQLEATAKQRVPLTTLDLTGIGK